MCLWEGITFAKDLAQKWKVPLIPTNHMEGHILSVFGKTKGTFKIPKVETPILSLLVSGGHTQLILSKKPARLNSRSGGWMQYEIIGETLDDAVGEAYDKVARMLGLPYPGGPEISRLAEMERNHLAPLLDKEGAGGGNSKKNHLAFGTPPSKGGEEIVLPRPMMYSKDFKFSYSGLKTAVLYLIRDLGGLEKISEETKAKIALEFENAAIECLIYKTAKAIEKYKIKTIIVGGGVACNTHLQREIKKLVGHAKGRASKKIKTYFPPKGLSGDNSLMIGIAGYLNYIKLARRGGNKNLPKDKQGKFFEYDSIKATGNLKL
jgi:N6-L-threonylcarbamoyladenine synthase